MSSSGGGSPLGRPENIVHQTMNTSSANAAAASTINNHMARAGMTAWAVGAKLAILGSLAACAAGPLQTPAPVESRRPVAAAPNTETAVPASAPARVPDVPAPAAGRPASVAAAPSAATSSAPQAPAAPPLPAAAPPAPPTPATQYTPSEPEMRGTPARPESWARGGARWTAAAWHELPGWSHDRVSEAWPALVAGCARPAPGWAEFCARALLAPPTGHEATRRWLAAQLQPYRIEPADGNGEHLLTGYFEPTLEASRRPTARRRVPLHAPPPDLAQRRPYLTRQQLDEPAGARRLDGLEIAWIEDPLDALLAQVQGSARLRLREPDGRLHWVRLSFAAHNDQPYRSLGRWLVEQGELGADGVSWPAIKAWAQRNPRRLNELLWANPRVVFFREEPLPDTTVGPRGAMGVPLTPGRSLAVDPTAIPLGAPVWLDSTEPLSTTPLRRLVLAQDTGGAIQGAVRGDLFWGWGSDAEQRAGRTRQALRLWVLWPLGSPPPGS